MKARSALLFLISATLTVTAPSQTAAEPTPPPAATPTPAEAPSAPDQAGGPRRQRQGNFNPADIQARMMANFREQLDVTDDAEWALISERITAITELRRGQLAGALGALGAMFGNRGGNRGGGAGLAANPEQDALRAAVSDHLPDAEITSRLNRLREARKQNEAKLEQARENLRAVLTVRQEAVAVMAGLLN